MKRLNLRYLNYFPKKYNENIYYDLRYLTNIKQHKNEIKPFVVVEILSEKIQNNNHSYIILNKQILYITLQTNYKENKNDSNIEVEITYTVYRCDVKKICDIIFCLSVLNLILPYVFFFILMFLGYV